MRDPGVGAGPYPGAILAYDADGDLAPLNDAARDLMAALDARATATLAGVVREARDEGDFAFRRLDLDGAEGARALELTLIPGTDGAGHVLCREATFDRRLRAALVESRQRYKDLVTISSDFAWETDARGRFVFVSPQGALGHRAEDLVGRAANDFLAREMDEGRDSPFAAREPCDRVQIWFRRAGGGAACLEATCLPLVDEAGRWRGARGVCRDVTADRERDAALAAARNRERLHSYILHAIRHEVEPDHMLGAAAQAVARALSAAACQVYRFSGVPRRTPAAESGGPVDPALVDPVLDRLSRGETFVEAEAGPWRLAAAATRYRRRATGALCLFRHADALPWTREDREVLMNAADQVALAIEQVSHHESLRRLSRTDPLTSLLNRRAFFEEVEARLARAGRRPGALVYVDLDNFKLVNDRLGHHEGDEALRAVADMLAANARSGDLVARLGGDEFALWLDGSDEPGAASKAAALLRQAEDLGRAYCPDPARPLGLSIGVAPHRAGAAEDLEALVARADLAMYEAKRGGKGGYRVAPPDPQAVA